ncbi:MAG: indole-3-glycerol phosphate synthase TrpC [Firmicutes bacterium]|nr:indole-3-glycerol phosphate synthase TrpC [Bacillota bacterium]
MTSILDRIIATKRVEVQALYANTALDDLKRRALLQPTPRSLSQALLAGAPLALIAEIKKASPSKGVIDPNFKPLDIARAYEKAGASALSVLTDRTYFQGSNDVLSSVREVTDLPILRKDFIIDEAQIWEARLIGADAILLIAAAIPEDVRLASLYHTAEVAGLDVLLEVHTVAEVERVASLNPKLIGVNNRDLRTFTVDLGQTENVAAAIAPGTLLISESGLQSAADVARVYRAGARAILVGETLMRFGAQGVAAGARALLAQVPT